MNSKPNDYIVKQMERVNQRPTRQDYMRMLGKGDVRLDPGPKNKKPLTTKEQHAKSAAPLQQDALNPIEDFYVLTAQERRLEEHYTASAKKMLAIRAENAFGWRDAERVAKENGLAERYGQKDATYSTLAQYAGESDPVTSLFDVEPYLSTQAVAHADRIVSIAREISPPSLVAANLRGQALMNACLYVAALTAIALSTQGGDK